jgi:lipopolysaccharide biosynthesis regulator YciM
MNNDLDTFTFQIDGNALMLNKLNKQMDEQFELMYRHYFLKQEFDIDLFEKSAMRFFDESSEVKLHDRFFNNFTILWQILIQNGSLFFAEQIWQLAVQIATQWESLNQSKYRIHKGAAYYFWAVTCILKEDLEKGFLLMHQALEEDKKNMPNKLTYTPAHAFLRLDYRQQQQYFSNKILEGTEFLEQKLKLYQSSRNGALTLDQLKSEFLDNKDLMDETFLLVYHVFHIKKLLSESKQRLTQNSK